MVDPGLTTLVKFAGTNGANPHAPLLFDAAGDLFGTTQHGGAYGGPTGYGTVFELVKTGAGYASTPTTLVSFNGTDGADPYGGLIADAAGDLFGVTQSGTVYEIVKTGSGYAATPTVLVTFNGTDGASPEGELLADPAGDLFGVTQEGGAYGKGTVFEIAKTAGGYASTPLGSTHVTPAEVAVACSEMGSGMMEGPRSSKTQNHLIFQPIPWRVALPDACARCAGAAQPRRAAPALTTSASSAS